MRREPDEARSATPADSAAVVATIVEAFAQDPTWRRLFPDPATRAADHGEVFGRMVRHAVSIGAAWTTTGSSAVALAFPPGADELSPADAAELPDLLRRLVGRRAEEVGQVFERFERARPVDRPHLYLSMLAVRNAVRGQGLGMALLRQILRRADALRVGTYLESSNPANDRLYAAAGFTVAGSIEGLEDTRITTMWRDPPQDHC